MCVWKSSNRGLLLSDTHTGDARLAAAWPHIKQNTKQLNGTQRRMPSLQVCIHMRIASDLASPLNKEMRPTLSYDIGANYQLVNIQIHQRKNKRVVSTNGRWQRPRLALRCYGGSR